VPPLAEGDEESQQEGAQNQPRRNVNFDGKTTGNDPQNETRSHTNGINDDEPFEPKGVEDTPNRIGKGSEKKQRRFVSPRYCKR
jgi:hypothetical protein